MNKFQIYTNGNYDRKKTLEFKMSLVLDEWQRRAALRYEEVNYYFAHHQKLIR
jgi:hypothetical protein